MISELEMSLPSKEDLNKFNLIAAPILVSIENNLVEVHELTLLRDYLMPKLMTGEIDVSTLSLPTKYSFSTPNPKHGQDHQRGAESEADRKD